VHVTVDEQEQTGLGVITGTYEEAKAMIGFVSEPTYAEVGVNWPMIKYFCALVEDANPSYWDPEFANKQWGDIICPPGMLITYMIPIRWRPSGAAEYPVIATKVPLPGPTLINFSAETEFFKPIRIGMHLNFVDEVLDISQEKETRVGIGHFVTTVMTYRDADGDIVAKNTNVMYRYKARELN
jgi:acyl dehydratase